MKSQTSQQQAQEMDIQREHAKAASTAGADWPKKQEVGVCMLQLKQGRPQFAQA